MLIVALHSHRVHMYMFACNHSERGRFSADIGYWGGLIESDLLCHCFCLTLTRDENKRVLRYQAGDNQLEGEKGGEKEQ